MPETAAECFEGYRSITDHRVPLVWDGLKTLNHKIIEIKRQLKPAEEKAISNCKNNEVKSRLDYDLNFLIENTPVIAATYADKGESIKIKNIFSGKEEDFVIKNTTPYNIGQGLLGIYSLDAGVIILFVDKIFQYENPELILQVTLIHEFIHAMLDISPRIIEADKTVTLGKVWKEEESISNTLYLFMYKDWNKTGLIDLKEIEDFTYKQPAPYNDSKSLYDLGYQEFEITLKSYLLKKIDDIENAFQRFENQKPILQRMYAYSIEGLEDSEIEDDSILWFKDFLEERYEKSLKRSPDSNFRKDINQEIEKILNVGRKLDDSITDLLEDSKLDILDLDDFYPFGVKKSFVNHVEDLELSFSVIIQDKNIENVGSQIAYPAYKAIFDFKWRDNRYLISFSSEREDKYDLFTHTSAHDADLFLKKIKEENFIRLQRFFFNRISLTGPSSLPYLSKGFPDSKKIRNAIDDYLNFKKEIPLE